MEGILAKTDHRIEYLVLINFDVKGILVVGWDQIAGSATSKAPRMNTDKGETKRKDLTQRAQR